MKRGLFIANIIALCIFIFYFAPRVIKKITGSAKKTTVQTEPSISPLPCVYSLEHFDFHFRKDPEVINIMMFGNSLIRHGKWDSLLKRKDVVNRGISGDNLRCLAERLKYLDALPAKIVFIEGGINDLPHQNTDSLFRYFTDIVSHFQKKNKVPVINLLTYISPLASDTWESRKDYKRINDSVFTLNNKLKEYAMHKKLDLIELNSFISDTVGRVLLNKFTTDGVHYTPEAYGLWAEQISSMLTEKNL